MLNRKVEKSIRDTSKDLVICLHCQSQIKRRELVPHTSKFHPNNQPKCQLASNVSIVNFFKPSNGEKRENEAVEEVERKRPAVTDDAGTVKNKNSIIFIWPCFSNFFSS